MGVHYALVQVLPGEDLQTCSCQQSLVGQTLLRNMEKKGEERA